MVTHAFSVLGDTDGPWGQGVARVLQAAGWTQVEEARLRIAVPSVTQKGADDFHDAQRLMLICDAAATTAIRDETGEVCATGQVVALFDGRIRTLKQHFAGRSAVDAARADIVTSGALAGAPGLRVNGLRIGAAPEGPDQRDMEWRAAWVSEISMTVPDLTRLPETLSHLERQKAVTGQIIGLDSRR